MVELPGPEATSKSGKVLFLIGPIIFLFGYLIESGANRSGSGGTLIPVGFEEIIFGFCLMFIGAPFFIIGAILTLIDFVDRNR